VPGSVGDNWNGPIWLAESFAFRKDLTIPMVLVEKWCVEDWLAVGTSSAKVYPEESPNF
jgi:hypothetical protein